MRLGLEHRGALSKLSPKLVQELDQIVETLNATFAQENGEDEYGILFGDPAGTHIVIDDVNGIQILNGSDQMFYADTEGNLTLAGTITALGGSIDGVLSIGADGGIYQGTGTFASPTTGLKVWNSGGIGRIAGYKTGVLQWGAATDGVLTAGAGNVTLNADGVRLTPSGTVDVWDNCLVWPAINADDTGKMGFGAFDISAAYIKWLQITAECMPTPDAIASQGTLQLTAKGQASGPHVHQTAQIRLKAGTGYEEIRFLGPTNYWAYFNAAGMGFPAGAVVSWESDTNLYRAAANTLKTDDSLQVAGVLVGFAGMSNIRFSAAADAYWSYVYPSDSYNRFLIDVDGKMSWGSGSAAADTNLYRTAADILKTDDIFIALKLGVGTSDFTATAHIKGVTALEAGGIDGTLADVVYFKALGYPTAQTHRIRSSHAAGVAASNKLAFETSTTTVGVYNTNQLLLTGDGKTNIAGSLTWGGGAEISSSSAIPWSSVSKSGSSLADLATRAVANLSDGANVAMENASIIPTTDNSYALGDSTHRFTTAYLYLANAATAGRPFVVQESDGNLRYRSAGVTEYIDVVTSVDFLSQTCGTTRITFTDGLVTHVGP